MAALLFKVGALALRTLAKPLGERFQRWVLSHPVYKPRVIGMARKLHNLEVYISRGAEGKTGRAFVGEMTEDKALQLASKIASEGFVFTVGVLVIMSEYDRTRRKDLMKKRQEAMEKQAVLEQAKQERERLIEENSQQFALLQKVMQRVEILEQQVHHMEEEQRQADRKGQSWSWGGFFGPRGL